MIKVQEKTIKQIFISKGKTTNNVVSLTVSGNDYELHTSDIRFSNYDVEFYIHSTRLRARIGCVVVSHSVVKEALAQLNGKNTVVKEDRIVKKTATKRARGHVFREKSDNYLISSKGRAFSKDDFEVLKKDIDKSILKRPNLAYSSYVYRYKGHEIQRWDESDAKFKNKVKYFLEVFDGFKEIMDGESKG